ncbi:MAG: hypothetical protein HKN87_22015 [Saprospiraceae bacterium]|nr:hypothetical protein [Saprospiraceae bacterium]
MTVHQSQFVFRHMHTLSQLAFPFFLMPLTSTAQSDKLRVIKDHTQELEYTSPDSAIILCRYVNE